MDISRASFSGIPPFNVKFPLLRLLLCLIQLKSTIISHLEIVKDVIKEILR